MVWAPGDSVRGAAVRSILLVPAAGSGDGLGHLVRCLRLAEQLAHRQPQQARVELLGARLDTASLDFLRRAARGGARQGRPKMVRELTPDKKWDLIVVDDRATSEEELRRLEERGPVVCLDEGGQARASASYLIDSIPRIPNGSSANLSSLSLLELPARVRRTVRWPPKRILVSFGGEDRENLSARLLDVLLGKGFFTPAQITLVEGPLFATHTWPSGVSVERSPDGLTGILRHHDAVFAHFGITALEAQASGVPVILFNPSHYHARLGKSIGFADIGVRVPNVRALKALLADGVSAQQRLDSFNARIDRKRGWQLPGVLASVSLQGSPWCPVCRRDGNKVIARFSDRTYRACAGCGVMYLESFAQERERYDAGYFGREYKAHYGRTYLEDFDSIKSTSRERLRILRELGVDDLEGAVVDVGCAYGPFLSAAIDEGLPAFGIDVSEEAVRHVRKKIGIPALCAPFETVQKRHLPGRVSAITLWYVLEHFQNVDVVLRKASEFLPVGGVLAFSTPNGQGISARKNMVKFLEQSPGDHFTVFTPAGLGKILAEHGFELRRLRITGHHPERLPGVLGKLGSGRASRALAGASRLLGLGDTFEAYAVKVEEP